MVNIVLPLKEVQVPPLTGGLRFHMPHSLNK